MKANRCALCPQYQVLFSFDTQSNITTVADHDPVFIWGKSLPYCTSRPHNGIAQKHTHTHTKSVQADTNAKLSFVILIFRICLSHHPHRAGCYRGCGHHHCLHFLQVIVKPHLTPTTGAAGLNRLLTLDFLVTIHLEKQ